MMIKHLRSSIRARLTFISVFSVLLLMGIVLLINTLFLPRLYRQMKIGQLKEIYVRLGDISKDDTSLQDELKERSVRENITITVSDDSFNVFLTSSPDIAFAANRLFGYYSGYYTGRIDVVENKDRYCLQMTTEPSINTTYLEMWGQLDNGYWFLMQTPMEALKDAAGMTNRFLMIAGIAVIILESIFLAAALKRSTEPLRKLMSISEKMADLDFDERYQGQTVDEVGRLGDAFNTMQDKLKDAVGELKTANVSLRRDMEKREKLDEQRTEFLHNVSHELKTPLALIQGYAEGLKEGVAGDDETKDMYLDIILDETTKMNGMIGKLLSLHELEYGNDAPEMVRFDLWGLIGETVENMRPLADNEGIKIEEYAPSESVFAWGDPINIEQVVTNYLSNAFHYASGEKKVVISAENKDDLVKITVFNTGDAIPEEDIPHLFEKFYKVDKMRSREYGGSGIGLSIVKAVIDAHHQQCGVDNYANGVGFWFTLDAGNTV